MTKGHRLNFLEHLDELRAKIIICLITLVLLSVAAYFISDPITECITRPIKNESSNVYFFSPHEAFLVKLKISLLTGFIASSPVIFMQTWLFITPGLYAREKKVVLPVVILATALFLCGILFAYFTVLPVALYFFLSFQSETLRPLISIKEYITFASSMLLSFGFIFNLPLLAAALTKLGIVNHSFLIKQRRYMMVLIFIIAALITPPDIFTQIMLAIPLIVLYEVCIVIAWFLRKPQHKSE